MRHRRFAARRSQFRHRLALLYLDLDELPRLLGGRLVRRRPGAVRVRRRDYLGDSAIDLTEAVRREVERQTGRRPEGPIRLLSQARTFGHCFNPVSFYYCFDPSGERLEHVVAEVTNTPWGERHAYVLSAEGEGDAPLHGESPKRLHVSPFMPMEQSYSWRVGAPSRRLEVHIESRGDGARAFDATLALRRRELTRRSLVRVCARFPLGTLRVLGLIYGHALMLRLRGVGVHPHPRAGAAA